MLGRFIIITMTRNERFLRNGRTFSSWGKLNSLLTKVRDVLNSSAHSIQTRMPKINSSTMASIVALLGIFGTNYSTIKNVAVDIYSLQVFLRYSIKNTLANTKVVDELKAKGKYLKRNAVENQISAILQRTEGDGVYYVIYGAKGVGKTTVVNSAISGHYGVLKIEVTPDDTYATMIKKLAFVTGTTGIDPSFDAFKNALLESKSTRAGLEGSLPTLIIEVDRSEGVEQASALRTIGSFAKRLSDVCNCIIVLSEANAILEFGRQDPRLVAIFIEELSFDEAKEYIKMRNVNLTDAEFTKMIDKIGANPAVLNKLKRWIVAGNSLDKFIEITLRGANIQLVEFQHQQILKALKDHPEGVTPVYFGKLKNEGVDLSNPTQVGVAMKEVNCIVFRMELGKYMMLSKAHEVELRDYNPIMPEIINTAVVQQLRNDIEKLKSRKWWNFFF